MRFLVDNSLPPRFASELRAGGHDAVHIRDVLRPDVDDEVIFERAGQEGRIILAQGTDFGTILTRRAASKPSLILFRRQAKSVHRLLPVLLANLATLATDLDAGAVVVLEETRIRVRRLPLR